MICYFIEGCNDSLGLCGKSGLVTFVSLLCALNGDIVALDTDGNSLTKETFDMSQLTRDC